MISIYKTLRGICPDGTPKTVHLGVHDSGVFCMIDVVPNGVVGSYFITEEKIILVAEEANVALTLEELDRYINNNNEQYIYEDTGIEKVLTDHGFTEVLT